MRKVLLAFALLVCGKASAQLEVSAGTGIGWYSMNDLHDLQEHLQSTFPVKVQITEKFPPYLIYDASLSYRLDRGGFLGIYYQFSSTAGRIYYEDFSGEIYSDQILRGNTLALNAGQELEFKNNFFMRIDLHPGATFTQLELLSVTRVRDQSYTESYKFHSINATMQPTVELHKAWGNLGIKVYVGCHFSAFAGKLRFEENKDSYLIGSGTSPITANWTGLRLGISGRYVFRQRD
jgi:hypothetical protein